MCLLTPQPADRDSQGRKYLAKFVIGARRALLNGDVVLRIRIQDGGKVYGLGPGGRLEDLWGTCTENGWRTSFHAGFIHDWTRCDRRHIRRRTLLKDWPSWFSRLRFAQLLQSSRDVSINVVVILVGIYLSLCMPIRLNGAELKPKTARAFDQYLQKAELRMNEELKPGRPFLWVDTLSSTDRTAAYARLRNGGILIHSFAAGLDVPGGMIHDWVGVVFIPNATLDETLSQIQDYNAYARIYSPEVTRSKTLEHDGNDFRVSLWLEKKSIVPVVLDVVQNVEYFRLDSSRVFSCAHSIRIREAEDSGTSLNRDHRSAAENGYIWKLDGFGWFLQTPSGVYIQFEAIALSRNIPWGWKWLIRPIVTKIPRESLLFTLARARASLEEGAGQPIEVDSAKPSGPGKGKKLANSFASQAIER